MSEERLVRIENKVDELATGQTELRQGQAKLWQSQAELWRGQTELQKGQAELRADVTELRVDVAVLKRGQTDIVTRLTKVEVIQEEMRDDIRAIAESHASLLSAMDRGFAMVVEELDRRLTPVELAIRKRH